MMTMSNTEDGRDTGADRAADSRRAFIRRAVYAAPVLLTLAAAPAFASTGSNGPGGSGGGGGTCKPRKRPRTFLGRLFQHLFGKKNC
jgi:hypothetical protein